MYNKELFTFTQFDDYDNDALEGEFLAWYDKDKPINNFSNVYYQSISHFFITNYAEEHVSYGDKGRWSQFVTKIIKIQDRFFSFVYDEALTEMQESSYSYDYMIEEVEPVTKTITITEWEKVKK